MTISKKQLINRMFFDLTMMLDRKAPKDDIGHYLIKKGTEIELLIEGARVDSAEKELYKRYKEIKGVWRRLHHR